MRSRQIWAAGVLVAVLAMGAVAQAPLTGPMVGAVGAPLPFVPAVNAGTDVVCALHADVIAGLTCNNAVTDGSTATTFATSATIPANVLSSRGLQVNLLFGTFGTATLPSVTLSLKLGSTTIYTGAAFSLSAGGSASSITCTVAAGGAASGSTPIVSACSGQNFQAATRNTLLSNTAKSIAVDTTVAQALTVVITFSANTTGNAVWLYSISPAS